MRINLRRTTEVGPAPAAAAPAGFASGLPIGWNPSTGRTSGQCLNYTIATPSNNVEQVSFSSQSTASSSAGQINVSATVSGAVDFFKASDTASFSDQWQSSTNSSHQYFNFFSLYTLDSTVSASEPLTAQGQGAGASFPTLCGSQYLSSVPVGMVATISINYGSSSSSTQTSIANAFSVSVGLDSVSAAVQAAFADTSSASYFTFSMTQYGGGTAAAAALQNAFAAENASDEAFYALCAQGNAEACTQFTSSMGQGAAQALNSFNQLVAGLSGMTTPDLSFFETFPNGVAGASTSGAVTTDIPPTPLPTSDVLAPYTPQLEQYVTLLNQIATLNNRVTLLQGLMSPNFNPVSLLDLVSYLDRLENSYGSDRSTLLTNLASCLAATSANVTSVCQPIIDNPVTNAFAYYGAAGPGNNFFAQQNTLALQYTAQLVSQSPPLALDVMYIDELPSFAAAGVNVPIAGQAALVSFADRPSRFPASLVAILALEPNVPLSTNNVSTTARANPPAPSPFTLWWIALSLGSVTLTSSQEAFTSVSCTPTFDDPCAIDYTFTPVPDGVMQHTQIEGLFD